MANGPQDLHVFGPAQIQIALNGQTQSYAQFGYTVDGVDIDPQIFMEDIPTDQHGPAMPADVQIMGQLATISLSMGSWNNDILQGLEKLMRDGVTGQVRPADIGTLLIAGNQFFGLKIVPTPRTGQGVTNFPSQVTQTWPCCHLQNSMPRRRGTRVTRVTLTVRALRNPSSGVLYTLG